MSKGCANAGGRTLTRRRGTIDTSFSNGSAYHSHGPHLALLDLVPAFDEMLNNIQHDLSSESHVYIVPRHAPRFDGAQTVTDIVGDVLEVHDTGVVVVLAGVESREWVGRMHIREGMRVRIPATETEVETADTCIVVIDDDDLFMVRPELDVV